MIFLALQYVQWYHQVMSDHTEQEHTQSHTKTFSQLSEAFCILHKLWKTENL